MAKKSDKQSKAPAISVIVAMYNTAPYVGKCLNSLLGQTMQDFEVIVVDDFSSDNSVEVVNEIAPKFEGRLKLIRLKKNSGFPGLPRNTAMGSARGKYITFLDSDDFFADKALAEIYSVAEEMDADVIHCEKYLEYHAEKNQAVIKTFQRGEVVKEPTLETEDIVQRVEKFINFRILWWACNKLFRRDFLVKNNIQFPNITAWEDLVFAFTCLLRAEKYVRVPNANYFYRIRNDSLSHKGRDAFEMTSNLIGSMKALDRAMEKTPSIAGNAKIRYKFIDWYVQARLKTICDGVYRADKWYPYQINEIFREKFFSKNISDQSVLYSYFFTIATFNKELLKLKDAEIKNLKDQVKELQDKLSQSESQKINDQLPEDERPRQ
ncbi:MAG: glycosyltransferase family 2 protein [Selenomonadaceae bacterium]|nr:glycosyltransferase family 2 protein [Selenomonadaceae bacterium]